MAASVELDAAVEHHGAPAASSVPVASGAATVEVLVPSPSPTPPNTSTSTPTHLMDLPDEVLIFIACCAMPDGLRLLRVPNRRLHHVLTTSHAVWATAFDSRFGMHGFDIPIAYVSLPLLPSPTLNGVLASS